MIIDWIANVFSISGAIIGSRAGNPIRARDMNCLYLIGNILGSIYFFLTLQWSFLILYTIYIMIAVKGIYINQKEIRKGKEFDIYYPK